MNSNLYFINKNPLKILCFSLVLTFLSISLKAQSKENPALLRKQISSSPNNTQKTALLQKLSDYYITKKGEVKTDLDSAAILNKEAMNLSLKTKDNFGRGKSMFLDAKIDKERGNKNAALSKMKQAIHYFEMHKMIKQAGEGYEELSFMYNNDPQNFEAKIKLKEKALEFYKSSNDKEKQARVLKDLGEIYMIIEKPDKSIELLKQSLDLYNSVKFKDLQGVYNFLSQVYIQKANYEEALKYALLAEKTAINVNDTSLQLSSIYSNVGMVYYYLRQNDDAIKYWEKE
jgi:tetratricopeptide (TPR) repeat protein